MAPFCLFSVEVHWVSRVRAVFFDAGNTLFAERTSRAALYAEVARRHGIIASVPDLASAMRAAMAVLPQRIAGSFRYTRPWFERYIADVFSRLGEAKLPPALPAELFATFARADTFRVFDEVRPTLTALAARGVELGVVSNWAPGLHALLEALGLAPYFTFMLSSAVEEVEKPDPRLFRRALALVPHTPHEVLHVGDQPEIDVVGAEAAGLRAVLLDRAGAWPDDVGQRIGSLSELLELLEDGHGTEADRSGPGSLGAGSLGSGPIVGRGGGPPTTATTERKHKKA